MACPNRSANQMLPHPWSVSPKGCSYSSYTYALTPDKPAQPSSVRLCCMTGRKRISLSGPYLSPSREAPAGASSKCSFLLTGGPEPCNCLAYSSSQAIPPPVWYMAGRGGLPTAIPAEGHKGWAQANCHP